MKDLRLGNTQAERCANLGCWAREITLADVKKERERIMEEYKDTLSGLSNIWFPDTAMEREINEKTKQLKRLEMIEKIKRIKDTLFGLDSPLQKIFADYNGYFKPRWDKIMPIIEIRGTTDYDGIYKRKGQVMTLLNGKAKLLARIEGLKSDNDKLRNSINDMLIQNKRLIRESDLDQRDTALVIEEAKSEIRKEMQESLIRADVLIAEAHGKLEAYEKLAITKVEMMKLFYDSLGTLSSKPDIKVLKAE